ncbi:MAG: energy-coupling factor ABC transporter ATP-binding protein [Microcella sp.]|uniref:energy-coupling factor ABC transporter ATP-binding protein n=1 Tax=Microcella sp. TaxID=1913979 RepID=UPI002725E337|nr:energy-coupling factor ABC transporter ATP-binding protein [Microcella sp.]MDO8337682.1 energy-coupling factor ABC transporter ATP-binding protein [Microcella sp.]
MTPAATPHAIVVDAVSVERNGVRVLESVTTTVDAHRVAVIGANGSGKSTFARLLNGLITPSSGSVRVAGLDPARQARKVRELVAFLFTNPESQIIMPTVAEDVAFSLRGSGLPREEVSRRVIGILSDYGLDGLADRSAHELSGGQKQLLALCSGLVREPQILVADEPTTLLDAANTRRVSDALVALPQRLVVVTHDLVLAARCDTALLFDRGRLIAQGDPAEVVARYEREFC